MPEPKPLISGRSRTIAYARAAGGTYPARDFLEGSDVPAKDKAALRRRIELLAAEGRITNREQFKKLSGELWELKSYQVRIGCFQHGDAWYLTHGFIKKKDKWPKAQLERAEQIRLEHLEYLSRQRGRRA